MDALGAGGEAFDLLVLGTGLVESIVAA